MTSGGGESDRRLARLQPGRPERWGIVLAGGDGTRLRELTRRLTGDDRPKQFCRLLGQETLLGETRRRLALAVPASRTLFAVTPAHERYCAPLLADVAAARVVPQPGSRGTAPAILHALLRAAAVAPSDPVAVVPSDQHVSDDGAFMAHVAAALKLAAARADPVTLLGVTADRPETEYGWIEPAEPLPGTRGRGASRVRRFWEKPAPALARQLLDAGCLWNSFGVVGRVAALIGLIRRALRALYQAFLPLREALGTPGEADAARAVYRELPATDFSRQVLAVRAAELAVLTVRGVDWSDLGSPHRLLGLRRAPAVPHEAAGGGALLVPAGAR